MELELRAKQKAARDARYAARKQQRRLRDLISRYRSAFYDISRR